jgi:chromosome segregation ATPase
MNPNENNAQLEKVFVKKEVYESDTRNIVNYIGEVKEALEDKINKVEDRLSNRLNTLENRVNNIEAIVIEIRNEAREMRNEAREMRDEAREFRDEMKYFRNVWFDHEKRLQKLEGHKA